MSRLDATYTVESTYVPRDGTSNGYGHFTNRGEAVKHAKTYAKEHPGREVSLHGSWRTRGGPNESEAVRYKFIDGNMVTS